MAKKKKKMIPQYPRTTHDVTHYIVILTVVYFASNQTSGLGGSCIEKYTIKVIPSTESLRKNLLTSYLYISQLYVCIDSDYSLIAFDERVTFWLQAFNASGHCLVHVRMLYYLRVGLRITITQSHTHTMQQTCTHKTVTRHAEAKKLLSRRRQLEYSME